MPLFAYGQIEIVVEKVPFNTPKHDTIFIVGSFNNWNPLDHSYFLTPRADGSYYIKFNLEGSQIEYKFTRGSWSNVEGGNDGSPLANRILNKDKDGKAIDMVKIKSWEDLETYLIVLSSIPENTPKDASIYISGNFNNWLPADPRYKLGLIENGQFAISIHPQKDTLMYKFTRGNWESVESYSNGRAVPDRRVLLSQHPNRVIENKIENWKDLSIRYFDFFGLMLTVSIFLGFMILIIINSETTAQFRPNIFFSLFLLILILALSSKLLMRFGDLFSIMPKLILAQDFFILLLAPVLYLYIRKLIRPFSHVGIWTLWLFVPAFVQFLFYVPYLAQSDVEFSILVVNRKMDQFYIYLSLAAVFYNLAYLASIIKLINTRNIGLSDNQSYEDYEGSISYVNGLVVLLLIMIIIASVTLIVTAFGFFTPVNTTWFTLIGTDILWVVFSSYALLIVYFMIGYPHLFKQEWQKNHTKSQSTQKIVSKELKNELVELMKVSKPYLSPKLTLSELAELLKTSTHDLSYAINEGYGMNFFDFVNIYRIEEFKSKVSDPVYKNHTFLAIAFESGFSSKTTFNRAFKKTTGLTPREYQNQQENTI
ncbi:MAG: helix-turn-helix domain-containing protein [Reichenbachiella sp.]|uniref:helix-turn-helix domain-containing protein n=1 Tax=Reichenbachiella sp. TaxID=2184521 RepID=UPI00329A736A